MLWRIQWGPTNRCSKMVNFWSTIKAKQNKAKEPFNKEKWPTEEMVDNYHCGNGWRGSWTAERDWDSCSALTAVSSSIFPLLREHPTLHPYRPCPPPTGWKFLEGKNNILFMFVSSLNTVRFSNFTAKINLCHWDGLKLQIELWFSDWQEWEFQPEESFIIHFKILVKHSKINGLIASQYHFYLCTHT